jgi:predicted dehydrogenase
MSERLGAAVIGLGVGAQHARAYRRLPDVELRWVYDLDQERARAFAAELGSVEVASSIQQILGDPRTDVVSIASYDEAHFEQVVAALDAGKHVFCEKPLCRSLEELAVIRRAAERSGRQLASNLVLRAAPLYRWLSAAVAAGDFGSLYAIDGDYLYGRLEKITGGWRNETPDYSVMQGGGVHLVDLMLSLAGERPRRVSATGSRICTRETAFRYHDFVAATFEFASGLVGRITANFGCVHRHQHVLRAFGTKATFVYDDAGARLHKSRDPAISGQPLEAPPLPASKGDLIPDFIRAIREQREPAQHLGHELAVIAACVAADRSLASDHPLSIEYP